MMKRLFLTLICVMTHSNVHASNIEQTTFDSLGVFQENSKYGYKNDHDLVVIPPIYDELFGFDEEGLAIIKKGKHYGVIDRSGTIVVPIIYDDTIVFLKNKNLAIVSKDGKFGYIDKQGKVCISLKYDFIWAFQDNGLALVKINNRFGFIDSSGKTIIPIIYEDADLFHNNVARVKLNGYYGYVDTKNNVVIPFEYEEAQNFGSDITDIETIENQITQITSKIESKIVAPNLARVKKDNKWILIDNENQTVTNTFFEEISPFTLSNLAKVKYKGKYGFINEIGAVTIPAIYDDAWDFSSSEPRTVQQFTPVKKNGKWAYINTRGQAISSFKFDDVGEFYNNLAPVKIQNKWGYINQYGKIAIPIIYDKAYRFAPDERGDYAMVEKGEETFNIDTLGKKTF